MKNPLTPGVIEPATFRFVAQHLNQCATAVPIHTYIYIYVCVCVCVCVLGDPTGVRPIKNIFLLPDREFQGHFIISGQKQAPFPNFLLILNSRL